MTPPERRARVLAGQYRLYGGHAWRVTLVESGTACLHRDRVWRSMPLRDVEALPLCDRDGQPVTVGGADGGEARWC